MTSFVANPKRAAHRIEVTTHIDMAANPKDVFQAVANLRGFLRFAPMFVHCAEVRFVDGWETAEAILRLGFVFHPVTVRHRCGEDGECEMETRGWPGFDLVRESLLVETGTSGSVVTIRTLLSPRFRWWGRVLSFVRTSAWRRRVHERLLRMRDELESVHEPATIASVLTIGDEGQLVEGKVVRRGCELHVRRDSPGGTVWYSPVTGDRDTYLTRSTSFSVPCPDHLFRRDLPSDATDVFLDVTRRCNLRCHACFASANDNGEPDPALDDVINVLRRLKTRPLVSIKGGEPTVRKELPDFIRAIRALGFPLKVNTNGLKFADYEYAKSIRDAGCNTVCLQWDGTDEDVITALRGRPLLATKRAAMANLEKLGFNVILAFMLVENQTGRQMKDVIEFAMRSPNISLVGILPVSKIGRNEFGDEGESLTMRRAFELIERDFAPKLLYEDFRWAQRLAARVSSVVGGAKFKALSCTFGQFLLHKDGDFIPATRLLSPREWRGRPWLVRAALALAWRVLTGRLTEARPNLLGIVVEKFMDSDGFDLAEAAACRKYYLSEGGFIQPCVYNTLMSAP